MADLKSKKADDEKYSADNLTSERCKSTYILVNLVDLVQSSPTRIENRRRYSREVWRWFTSPTQKRRDHAQARKREEERIRLEERKRWEAREKEEERIRAKIAAEQQQKTGEVLPSTKNEGYRFLASFWAKFWILRNFDNISHTFSKNMYL